VGLGINGGFLIVQLVNFVIVFLILMAFWPRIMKFLDDRNAKIAKSLEDARIAEQARANAERDAQKLLDEQRGEAAKLIEAARTQADSQAREILEQAHQDAEAIRTMPLKNRSSFSAKSVLRWFSLRWPRPNA
jgi:F-type H+-transporting ATPase subunit b